MYLCHGPVDAPMGAKGAPTADELLFGFCKFHAAKLLLLFRIFKIF
jgi:hypothetical protein